MIARFSLAALVALLFLVAFAGQAAAHTVGLSRSEWRVDGQAVSLELALARADAISLAPSIDADHDAVLTPAEVAAPPAGPAVLAERVFVRAGGAPCPVASATLSLVEEDGAAVSASFACPAGPITVELGPLFAALAAGHRQAAFVHEGGATPREALLHTGASSLTLGAGASAPPPSHLDVARDYVILGVEHIWFGIDHVVFLLGLVLIGGRLRDVIAMATAFTVAHSITLALAVLGIVAPSGAFIEPAIALSVAYVGVENLRGTEPSTRWRITALFGLVHGFGFAGALAEVGLPEGSVPLALVTFNVGVELGQLAILAVVVPILARLHQRPWFRDRAVRILSVAIVVAGVAWFVERVFL